MQNTCTKCGVEFEITTRDEEFYEKMKVPPPTHCPDCRLQRRLAWRVTWTLYIRKCDISGKDILSIFPPDAPYTICHHEEWYNNKANALDFGQDFDFNRPFFEQFNEVLHRAPLQSLSVDFLQNSDYVNEAGHLKNCYLIVESDGNQDSLYSYRILGATSCVDCIFVKDSEWCYECTDCVTCNKLLYGQLCEQCRDSTFLFDCRGCQNCFGCVGLRKKQFCIFNEQLTEEEYKTREASLDLCNPEHVQTVMARFEELKRAHPRKAITGEQNDNVSGEYINESKECFDCYDIRQCRDCKYCHMLMEVNDCMDYYVWGMGGDRIYECLTCGYHPHSLRFCVKCWEGVHNLTYCFQCTLGTNNCFGCVAVHRGEYCILNKQYSKEEYEKLVPKIIEHMKKTGEWGEFFPASISPHAYNETSALEYFPLNKEEVINRGLKWQDNLPTTTGEETVSWNDIPYDIDQVTESICDEVLACERTGKNFRITKQELAFYKQMRLPIPRIHYYERHLDRKNLRNPRKLWKRSCDNCGTEIMTAYAPERPEIVYCETCYHKEVYG
jgi:hypothetical protein